MRSNRTIRTSPPPHPHHFTTAAKEVAHPFVWCFISVSSSSRNNHRLRRQYTEYILAATWLRGKVMDKTSLCPSSGSCPLCSLFLCAHCSSVPTVTQSPLYLCAHCSHVSTAPLYPLFLYVHCSSVLITFLCSIPLFNTKSRHEMLLRRPLILDCRINYLTNKEA